MATTTEVRSMKKGEKSVWLRSDAGGIGLRFRGEVLKERATAAELRAKLQAQPEGTQKTFALAGLDLASIKAVPGDDYPAAVELRRLEESLGLWPEQAQATAAPRCCRHGRPYSGDCADCGE